MKQLSLFLFSLLIITAAFAQADSTARKDEIFSFAEQMPEFPGSFTEYLQKNIKYPRAEKEAGIQGTVYMQFVIEKDGSISNVEAVKEVPGAPGLTAEAVRVISAMPNWKPGYMNGKPVRITITQPIKFVMDDASAPRRTLVCGINIPEDSLDPVTVSDNMSAMPRFPGGDTAMQKFFAAKLKASHGYMPYDKGCVWIEFIVDTLGTLQNISIYGVYTGPAEMAAAAGSVFCIMPAWSPGKMDGKRTNTRVRVKVAYNAGDIKLTYSSNKTLSRSGMLPPPPPPPPPPGR